MRSRLAGRLLTSPVAFLVAGMLDLAAFALLAVAGRKAAASKDPTSYGSIRSAHPHSHGSAT